MHTTTMPVSARERNEATWNQAAEAMHAGRIDEYIAFWTHDGRYEVAYPVEGMPAAVEGHEQLTQLFTGFLSAAEKIEVHDVRFHQTDDPDVAFIEERMVVDLVGGGRYENRFAIRATFRDGLIRELFEYYGYREHEALIQSL
jgi:ketosteroid isomerase-like protein